MNSDIEQAKKELGKKAEKEIPKLFEKAKNFVSENIVLAGSYIGGFLIGLSTSQICSDILINKNLDFNRSLKDLSIEYQNEGNFFIISNDIV